MKLDENLSGDVYEWINAIHTKKATITLDELSSGLRNVGFTFYLKILVGKQDARRSNSGISFIEIKRIRSYCYPHKDKNTRAHEC